MDLPQILITFVFCIKNHFFTIKIWITNTCVVRKQVLPTPPRFILWMLKTYILQNSIQILLPKPSTIKQDTINLFLILTVLQFLMAKDLQAKSLQITIFAEIWMIYWSFIQIDNPIPIISVITRCGIVNQADRFFGFFVIIKNVSSIGMACDIFYSVSNKLSDRIIHSIFPCSICHFSRKWDILPDMTLNINSSTNIGIIIVSGLILLVQSLSQRPFQESGKQID